jgi:hypothetical protein
MVAVTVTDPGATGEVPAPVTVKSNWICSTAVKLLRRILIVRWVVVELNDVPVISYDSVLEPDVATVSVWPDARPATVKRI